MRDWIGKLAAAVARDGRAVRVTIAQATGSTPRESGTTMIVGARECHGTIGGGHLEFEAIRIARDALAHDAPAGAWLVRFPLSARLGQCCGGVATLAFSEVDGTARGWLDAAAAAERDAVPLALVTRIGAAPAQLVVTEAAAAGSLGTPDLDAAATAIARARIAAGEPGAWLAASPDGDGATLLTHVIVPAGFDVLVFGNGHVGRALVQVFAALPARVRWIDDRDADFPSAVPDNVEVVATDLPAAELAAARPGAYVIVTTHSHALDFDIVGAALARDDWRYVGLIGSKAKRSQFERKMAARGLPPERFARVTCPIGVSGGLAIRSKEPGAIAVAVAAEILALRENGVGLDFASSATATSPAPAPNNRV
ncbi:MAG: xanthine dehydrogenase accessory protein XdhC [Burkholderiales bacterium]